MEQARPRPFDRRFNDLERIRAEQARTLYRNCPLGVISAAVVSILVAVALGRTSQPAAVFWSLSVVGCAAAHLVLCWAYCRAAPATARWRRWLWVFSSMAFVEGMAWCIGAIILTSPDNFPEALIILLAWAGVSSGGVVVFGAYLPTYLLFFYPTMLPTVFLTLLYRHPYFQLMAALEITFLIALPLIALRFNLQLIAGLRLQFANLDLAEDLRRQKELAEEANIAKSQFLAAVSHDLRQPVHALGLFIGALRDRQMDEEAHRLVDLVDSSVAAMGELFTSLLDISKLDAGAVQPSFECVDLGPLLQRLWRECADEADAKGIAVRCLPRTFQVRSDGVLLERVVRNLILNAVRYTDAGGVLIGCRARRDAIILEVWDTGRGIADQHSDLIFREFYQVGNPERDRSKGVGLGLAIVKRVARLIEADLSFKSQLGRGSVFRLTMARATPGKTPAPDAIRTIPDGARNALVAVIDDDLLIQQAMRLLLPSWGYDVAVAGSGAEMLEQLENPASTPDLIICDYRLREQETGVQTIARLHQRFGRSIPAMLVTGDTAPDCIAEAQASGFALLHKPLSNSRLRAAIGNLLRSGS